MARIFYFWVKNAVSTENEEISLQKINKSLLIEKSIVIIAVFSTLFTYPYEND